MNAAVVWGPFLVFMGAGCGALVRWSFGLWWNQTVPGWPWGTLAANLVGGLGVGLLMAALSEPDALGWGEETRQSLRLFAITGFLGGLTTFSTFSAEVIGFVAQGRWGEAGAWATAHLLGSLALTALGWWGGAQLWPLMARGA